ncbi:MAG TPA: HupE/UreJ family protein [Saprospiraceae bacterium]|nr:HupE/UreJ family protein [Saprospiraceae bacterium]HRO08909.1 HupE/UreJ family protein [Saprospiraceae bacterium]HRP42341.1 HupE/UreJ family protein [Saprospiraceae bacterium]
MFYEFLKLGLEHILDLNGFDHILFVTVLCALYNVTQWKKILILVTAFTLGHSLTLVLSSLDMVRIAPDLVETLIPITIIITAIINIFMSDSHHVNEKNIRINYLMALLFGLIHGLGFSNYFKAIMGREQSIIKPLFAFNVGVELGQIVIVACVMLLGYVCMSVLKIPKKYWTSTISVLAIAASVWILVQ